MEDRNILWLVFTQSDWRVTIVDWYDVVGRLVADFRAAMAEHLDEPRTWKGARRPAAARLTGVHRLLGAARRPGHREPHEARSAPDRGPAESRLHEPVGRPADRHTDRCLHAGGRADARAPRAPPRVAYGLTSSARIPGKLSHSRVSLLTGHGRRHAAVASCRRPQSLGRSSARTRALRLGALDDRRTDHFRCAHDRAGALLGSGSRGQFDLLAPWRPARDRHPRRGRRARLRGSKPTTRSSSRSRSARTVPSSSPARPTPFAPPWSSPQRSRLQDR